MPFRSRRRNRSASEPYASGKNTHTLIVQLPVSDDRDKDEAFGKLQPYIMKMQNDRQRLPSSFELRRFMQGCYGDEKPEWTQHMNLVMDTTERSAENWILGESIDAALMHRSSSPKPTIDPESFYETNKSTKCCICQRVRGDTFVALRACGCQFHKQCIEKAYGFSTHCPICSISIDDYPVVYDINDYEIVCETLV